MDSHKYVWRVQDGHIVEMMQPGTWPAGKIACGINHVFVNGNLCHQPHDPVRLPGNTYGTFLLGPVKPGDSVTLLQFYKDFPMVPNTMTFGVEELKPTGDDVGTVEVILTLHHHANDPFPNITGKR